MNKKLTIEAYENIDYASSERLGELIVQINPESYKLNRAIYYGDPKEIQNTAQIPTFKNIAPSTLSFDIVFDGTGIIPTGGKTVEERRKELENIVYRVNGKTQAPCFLKIKWGPLEFQGRLTGLNWSYTLFAPSGEPLRVKASLTLTEAVSKREAQAVIKQDDTGGKFVTVKEGETLPFLCDREYKKAGYASMIASVNDLVSFRNIKPGTQLWFPKL